MVKLTYVISLMMKVLTDLGDMYATPTYTASKHAVTALTRTFGVS